MPASGSSSAGTVVVTGASGGIGGAIARHLLDAGWRVLGVDLTAAPITHECFESLVADLTDAAFVARIAERLRSANAFVHCAGVMRAGKLGKLDHDAGDLMWRLHVQAAESLADLMVPAMAARKRGRVVFIGSRVASGMPGRGQYAATKAALVAMARSWAAECVADGVTINVVSPAATETAMLHDPARASSAPRLPPIGRLIRPGEIASLVAYLLSPAADAITGQEIAICGGASLNR